MAMTTRRRSSLKSFGSASNPIELKDEMKEHVLVDLKQEHERNEAPKNTPKRKRSTVKKEEEDQKLNGVHVEKVDLEEESDDENEEDEDLYGDDHEQLGIHLHSEELYKIDCYREVRENRTTGKKEYLIHWLGHPESANTWEPEDNIPSETKQSPPEKFDPFFDKGAWIHFYTYLFERMILHLRKHQPKAAEKYADYEVEPLLTYYPTMNVYDELDMGTTWFHRQIRDEKAVLQSDTATKEQRIEALKTFVFKSICYSMMCRRPTYDEFEKPLAKKKLEEKKKQKKTNTQQETNEKDDTEIVTHGIPDVEEWGAFKAYVEARSASGESCFSGGHQNVGFRRFFKCMEHVIKNRHQIANDIWTRRDSFQRTCEEVIRKIPQVGAFFSQQICNDLVEIKVLKMSTDWCSMGPGAVFGARLIWPGTSQSELVSRCVQLYREQENAFKELGLDFPFLRGERIPLHNFEHGLCQWQGYFKLNCKLPALPEVKAMLRQRVDGLEKKPRVQAQAVKHDDEELQISPSHSAEQLGRISTRSSSSRKRSSSTRAH